MKSVFLFLYALVIGFILVGLYLRFFNNQKEPVQIKIPKNPFIGTQFSLEDAPSQSIKGKIVSVSGSVKWLSRIATESAKLDPNIQIQQGEQVSTEEMGKLLIDFDKKVSINLSPKTKVDVIQTLPDNLVFYQTRGSVEYKKTGSFPVSIRALHLLVENGGTVTIAIDELSPVVTITAVSGNSKIAFNDQQYVSNVIDLFEGRIYTFNDDTRQGDLK